MVWFCRIGLCEAGQPLALFDRLSMHRMLANVTHIYDKGNTILGMIFILLASNPDVTSFSIV